MVPAIYCADGTSNMWDADGCEYPKGSGKQLSLSASFWGIRDQQPREVAGQLYTEPAYWPGPYYGMTYDSMIAFRWNRIWKVTRAEIDSFLAIPKGHRTKENIPASIWGWPALFNPHAVGGDGKIFAIDDVTAPWVDVDHSTDYYPESGDYPDIKGDQALWWMFNDQGFTRFPDDTATDAIPIVYKVLAYGYNRGTAADRIIFYEVTALSVSRELPDFRFGLFNDGCIGNPSNDRIAFDSSHRMAIVYNGAADDEPGDSVGYGSYGSHAPMYGVALLQMPGDNYPSSLRPLASFNYFDRTYGGEWSQPETGAGFNNLMHGKGITGTPRPFDGAYAFPLKAGTDPCDTGVHPADMRYLMVTDTMRVFGYERTRKRTIAFALLVTDTTGNACGSSLKFKELTDLADTAFDIYYHPLPAPLAVRTPTQQPKQINLYPVPATDELTVDMSVITPAMLQSLRVVDAMGRMMPVVVTEQGNKLKLDVRLLPPGVYAISFTDGSESFVRRFSHK